MLSIQLLKPLQSWSPEPCVCYQNGNSQESRTPLHQINFLTCFKRFVHIFHDYYVTVDLGLYSISTCINAQGFVSAPL